jgi:hypothetical protein
MNDETHGPEKTTKDDIALVNSAAVVHSSIPLILCLIMWHDRRCPVVKSFPESDK